MISSTDVQDVVVQLNCDKIVLKGQDIETFLEDVKGKIQISEGGSSTSPSGLQIQDIEGLSAELNKKVEQDALETLVNTSVETALEPLDMKISSEVQEELTLQMKTYEETFDEKIQTAIDSITIDENAVKEIISENFNDNLVNDTSFKSLQSSIPTEENIKTIASDNFNDNLVNNEAFKAVKAKAEEVPIIKTSQISDRVTVDENDTSGVPTVNACELVISEAQEQVYEKFDQFLDKSLVSDSTQKVTWVFEPENTNTDWVLTVDDDYYLIISPSQSVTWTNISGTISIKSALGTDSLNFNTADAYNEEASEDVISYTQNAPKTLKIFLYKLTPNNIPVAFTINLTNLMNDTTALPNVTISEFKVNNSVQIPSLSCVNDKLENEYLSKQYVINDKELDYVFTWAKEDGPLSPCYLYEYDQDNKQIVITVTDNILGGGGSEYWYKVTGPYDASIGWSDEAQETVQVTSWDLTNETYFENWSVHYDFSLHPGYITAKYNFDLEAAMGVEDTYFFEHGFFSVMYLEGKYSRRYLTCPTNITVTRVKKSSVQHTYLDGEKTSWEMVGYSSRNSENDVTFEWNFFLDDGVLKAYPLDTSETITGQISRRYLSGELGSTATFDTSTAYVENEAVFWKQNDPSSLRLVFCKPDDEKAEQIYTMRLQISSLGNWWQVIYCRLRKRDIQLVSSAYFHDRLNNLEISDINLLEDELQYLEEEVGKVKTQNPFKGKYISILSKRGCY